ncbi:MAG: LLM class flavin-dependent oxidoreductase [Chloroflexi bacterium]|nr:LLM class flavin-dependent oxidoreductase [Chloroflexota bacterium]
MQRELSIAFQTDKTPAQYIWLAQLVDQYDFDVVSVYSDAPYHPSFGPLMLMAPHIKRARLGVAAVSPSRMTPVDMAGNIALLAQIAKGGVYLGIARGAWLAEYGIQEIQPPIQAIRESITIVKQLLSGEFDGFAGTVYTIGSHLKIPYELPEKPVRFLVGTWGPKLCRVAGEIADEVKIGGSANPNLIPVIRRYLAQGEQLAQRQSGSTGIVLGAVTVVDEDRELARRIAKESVALYLPVVAQLDPTVEIEPNLTSRLQELVRSQNAKLAASLISDSLLDRFAFSGNVKDIIQQTMLLFEAGATRVEYGTPHGYPSETGIRLLGKQVLPVVKKALV